MQFIPVMQSWIFSPIFSVTHDEFLLLSAENSYA